MKRPDGPAAGPLNADYVDRIRKILAGAPYFDLLGMISFITGNEHEVRSWPVRQDICAHDAAGAVHSDMKRGFIKAEVVAFDDLDRLGSWSKARDEGKLHLHGKDYIVQDGDVILFRFNV